MGWVRSGGLGLACALALLGATAPAASAVQCATPHWVGSWAASPSNGSTTRTSLSRQTVRMIVRTSLGGSQIRLRLSNRHGDAPVTLSATTIGRRDAGAAIVASTLRSVRFGGRQAVTIPAHGEVASDPVDLPVAALEDLAVSVHVGGTINRPTEHFITRQTNYITFSGSGDKSADPAEDAFSISTRGVYSTGWYFLSDVEVLAPSSVGTVVAFGDSTTDGYQGLGTTFTENFTDVSANTRYPDFVAGRLVAAGRHELGIVNAGISGNQLLADSDSSAEFGQAGLTRFGADALEVPGVSAVLILIGINDLGRDIPPIRVIEGLQQLMERAHARGLRVVLGTIPPTGGTRTSRTGRFDDTASNISREAVNRWIRSPTGAEAIVDFDAVLRDPAAPAQLRPGYDSSDHLHPNSAGYRAMAGAVNLTGLTGPACDGPDVVRAKATLTLARRLTSGGRKVVASGRLSMPAGTACPKAPVALELRGGGRTLSRRRPALRSGCRYIATFAVGAATPRRLSLRAAFAGTPLLLPAKRSLAFRLRAVPRARP